MVKARKLGHFVMNVCDLDASIAFYTRVIAAEVVSHISASKIAFLSLGEQHHDIALVQRATGPAPDATQPGLVHMAWQLGDFTELQAAHTELTEAGIKLEPIQHNITNSLYMEDPDGNTVELYCDRWGEKGLEVLRTAGPQRKALNMETGEAVGDTMEVLKAKVKA
jgi:catechol 2,3-dioxygenase